MHPEWVPLLCATEERVRPLQGRDMGWVHGGPGVARRADESDPFRAEDGEDKDANIAVHGRIASSTP